MKFPVNMLKISLLIKFTKETCLFAKLPVIMYNYQFQAFTPTVICVENNWIIFNWSVFDEVEQGIIIENRCFMMKSCSNIPFLRAETIQTPHITTRHQPGAFEFSDFYNTRIHVVISDWISWKAFQWLSVAELDQGIIIENGGFMVTRCSNIPFSRAEALVCGEKLMFWKPVNLEIGREHESMWFYVYGIVEKSLIGCFLPK